jgi:hypothetical protein
VIASVPTKRTDGFDLLVAASVALGPGFSLVARFSADRGRQEAMDWAMVCYLGSVCFALAAVCNAGWRAVRCVSLWLLLGHLGFLVWCFTAIWSGMVDMRGRGPAADAALMFAIDLARVAQGLGALACLAIAVRGLMQLWGRVWSRQRATATP